ncbi:uncharacterized protein [Penaeus vannamei]|uniref:uncharacterized protein n=1 Tax=Penaeus vannamei TaxID=6689 RepID=UPI00387F7802
MLFGVSRASFALASLGLLAAPFVLPTDGEVAPDEDLPMVSRPLNCIPEGGRVERAAASSVLCASMCQHLSGLAFIFSGGLCDMRGVGLGQNLKSQTFARFHASNSTLLQDVSRGKPVEATLAYYGEVASKAVDDDMATMYHSANDISSPWWLVDMQDFHLVLAVDVLTRQDATSYRFHDIEIRVGTKPRIGQDFSTWALLGEYQGPYTVAEGRLNFTSDSGLCGRYVVIHKTSTDTDHLQLRDVKVYVQRP